MQRGGLSNAHTHPQKIHIKINHIIKGFPLGQYLSDFEIRSGKIDLNGLINSFRDRVLLQGGGLSNAHAHPQKIHPKISHIIIGFPLGQYLSDFEIRSGKIDLNGLINSFYDRVLLQGGGSTNAQAHPLKIHPKISHIIIGFPLGQYLSDFEIHSGNIDLDGFIDGFGDMEANLGGRFYCREGVHQTHARTQKNTPQNQPHHHRLPPWSIFVGF